MSNITKSDLKSFAKVLIAIGNKVNIQMSSYH